MALTKYEVENWIRRVRDKATNAIDEQHTILFLSAVNKYLDATPTLGLAIKDCENAIAAVEEAQTRIKLYGGKCEWNMDVPENIRLSAFPVSMYHRDGPPKHPTEEMNKIEIAWRKEKRQTSDEYDKIVSAVRSVSAMKGVKLLTELGFDTSKLVATKKLNPETDINKKLLFPCKENK